MLRRIRTNTTGFKPINNLVLKVSYLPTLPERERRDPGWVWSRASLRIENILSRSGRAWTWKTLGTRLTNQEQNQSWLGLRALSRAWHGLWLIWPLQNLYFDSFLLICTSFVLRAWDMTCVSKSCFLLLTYSKSQHIGVKRSPVNRYSSRNFIRLGN